MRDSMTVGSRVLTRPQSQDNEALRWDAIADGWGQPSLPNVRRGFTLLEVLLAALILGFGLTTILVSMSQSQKMMLASVGLETAQEVMDWGEMAYPLVDVEDPEKDLDVTETKATELWEKIAGKSGARLTSEQEDKFKGYTWERENLDKNISEDDLKRANNIYRVRITVRWGNDRRGNHEEESYVTLWRKSDE